MDTSQDEKLKAMRQAAAVKREESVFRRPVRMTRGQKLRAAAAEAAAKVRAEKEAAKKAEEEMYIKGIPQINRGPPKGSGWSLRQPAKGKQSSLAQSCGTSRLSTPPKTPTSAPVRASSNTSKPAAYIQQKAKRTQKQA